MVVSDRFKSAFEKSDVSSSRSPKFENSILSLFWEIPCSFRLRLRSGGATVSRHPQDAGIAREQRGGEAFAVRRFELAATT
jgi:hypothetical protein